MNVEVQTICHKISFKRRTVFCSTIHHNCQLADDGLCTDERECHRRDHGPADQALNLNDDPVWSVGRCWCLACG